MTNENGGTAIQVKSDPRSLQFKHLLESDRMQKSLKAALPRHIEPNRMIRTVLGEFSRNPKVLECTPESVLSSIMTAAFLGLDIGGPLGEAYLVPFWSGKAKRMECQFIAGYRGLIKLARQSDLVADVWAEVVYEKDEFSYELGLEQTLKHKRNDELADVGELKYAYAVARFKDGERKFVVLNKREIEAIRAKSASKTKDGTIIGPWTEHTAEMWKKTAVRRLAKMLPLSAELARNISADDDGNTIDLPDMAALTAEIAPQLEHVPAEETQTVEGGAA